MSFPVQNAATATAPSVLVTGAFDNMRSLDFRFLQEASKHGPVTVLLSSDASIRATSGAPPKFPLEERVYFLKSLRYVSCVIPVETPKGQDALALEDRATGVQRGQRSLWLDRENSANTRRERFCREHNLDYVVLSAHQLAGFPEPEAVAPGTGRKKVVVTGCYDWLHSGHVRFFEEVSSYGDLYVVVGHDANIRLLKGEGHPLLCQEERRYLTGSIRFVTQSLISTGQGWLDADPEIQRLKPDIYAVNEDGDRGGKREYCLKNGIEYLVLKRVPATGLPKRSSTDLRGF